MIQTGLSDVLRWLSDAAHWLSGVLPIVAGALIGSSLTYGLSWLREHRRTLDAYRAPQRQAIGEILAAAHEFQLCLLEWRIAMSDLVEAIREDCEDNLPTVASEIQRTQRAYAVAMLHLRSAFEVGSLTVVDVKCWEALTAAVAVYSRFTDVIDDGLVTRNANHVEQLINGIAQYAEQLRASVTALVQAGNERVGPAETSRNRRRRRKAQRRLAQQIQARKVQEPEASQAH